MDSMKMIMSMSLCELIQCHTKMSLSRQFVSHADWQNNTTKPLPFIKPGIKIEPSMVKLYQNSESGLKRFRLGNNIVEQDWKNGLGGIQWSKFKAILPSQIQSFLQSRVAFHIKTVMDRYNILNIQAIQKRNLCWYVMIETEQLEEYIVLKFTFVEHDTMVVLQDVSFEGYSEKQIFLTELDKSSSPKEVDYYKHGHQFLHQQQTPMQMVCLDKTSVHTIGKVEHSNFSKELQASWTTTLHPSGGR